MWPHHLHFLSANRDLSASYIDIECIATGEAHILLFSSISVHAAKIIQCEVSCVLL